MILTLSTTEKAITETLNIIKYHGEPVRVIDLLQWKSIQTIFAFSMNGRNHLSKIISNEINRPNPRLIRIGKGLYDINPNYKP